MAACSACTFQITAAKAQHSRSGRFQTHARAAPTVRRHTSVALAQVQRNQARSGFEWGSVNNAIGSFAAAALLGITVGVQSAAADPNSTRLPPVNDTDPNRCERAFTGNTIGQANAVSNDVLDFRGCSYESKDLTAKTLSGAIMLETNFKNANMSEVVMSKAYAVSANFEGVDFSNAVVDRVDFSKANMRNTNFFNAIITGSSFDGADLTEADFTDALVGSEDVKRMCRNPTVQKLTRLTLGCKN